MVVKADGPGGTPEVHRRRGTPGERDDHRSSAARSAGGLTWIAHPYERMRRASHAVAVDDGVLVVEPVDADGVDDLLADVGPVAGVVVLSDYHRRDAAAVARRHDVPVSLPRTVADIASDIDAPVERFDGTLPGTSFEAIPLLDGFPWSEAALYDAERGILVATETLVTSAGLTGPGERLAVTPYVRLRPPRAPLRGLDVEHVLVGHGSPVLDDAEALLDDALANALTGAPGAIAGNLPYLLRAAAVAIRD